VVHDRQKGHGRQTPDLCERRRISRGPRRRSERRVGRSHQIAIAVVIGVLFLSADCSTTSSNAGLNASLPGSSGSSRSGGDPIQVGAISSLTGAAASDFSAFVPGVEAYFRMVDAHGGVDGRQLVLQYNQDDGSNQAIFADLASKVLEEDHVFAAFVSTLSFTPNLFASTGTPTYGYNVTGNWAGFKNLFSVGGSIQDYHVLAPGVAFLLKRTHSRSVAVISYGPGIPASYPACTTLAQDLKRGGITVSDEDLDAPLGGDYTVAVQQIQSHGSDFVVSCLGGSDNISLARDLQQYGVRTRQLWFNGYDQSLLDRYRGLMQGIYVDGNGFVPFSAAAAFPGVYPGIEEYLTTMRRYAPADVSSQLAMQGWQSAALFVEGLRLAGVHATAQALIKATNRLTAFTAGGVSAPIDWSIAHTTQHFPDCTAFVRVEGTAFFPVPATGHRVFVCFPEHADLENPVPVSAPAGTPGG
jgi:branched-chain amino acid transport system substrate-binding protein